MRATVEFCSIGPSRTIRLIELNGKGPHQKGSDLPSPIVLYDGGCALCDRTVRWLLRHDESGHLFYAPLEGETADRLREQFPQIPREMDTVVFVELDQDGARISLRSRAVFRVALYLDPPWQRLAWMRWIPPIISDFAYRLVAWLRHRLGEGLGPVPPPSDELKARFLG